MTKQEIINKLKKVFKENEIEIITKDNIHFNLKITSDLFKNKKILERQRIIYNILKNEIANREIHALSIRTYTKNEWKEN